MAQHAPRRVARRRFLKLLLGLGVALGLPLPAGARRRREPALDPRDRAIAALAAAQVDAHPDAARRIARRVEARLGASLAAAPERERARAARRLLLAPERIDPELARGDVRVLSGWVLARSEAELAIYLRFLARA